MPNVGPHIYTTLAFLALLGAPYIYDISSLRVKMDGQHKRKYGLWFGKIRDSKRQKQIAQTGGGKD